jgi:medium-chain acyl-[acyl-carrier-protein] hydrolase
MTDYWLVRPRPSELPVRRLFCFTYAGGGPSIFNGWADLLPADVEPCFVQLPGREARMLELPFTSMPAAADAVADALRPYLDVPFAFFGHSLGGIMSFEVARRLRAGGERAPELLVVSACRAPQLPPGSKPIHALPDEQFVQALREMKGTPHEVLANPRLLELVLPTVRADLAVFETYRYEPEEPLTSPISVLGGREDTIVTRREQLPWSRQTRSVCFFRAFPGDHFFLLGVRELVVRAIAQDLARVERRRVAA